MTAKPIIETQGLVKRFGGVEVLSGIDFSIDYGELRCLIGPNGAGKSTFFKCITGQLKPTAGAIKFKNETVTAADAASIAQRGMGIKTQVPSLYDGLTVREHIRLAVARRLSRKEVAAGSTKYWKSSASSTSPARSSAGLPTGSGNSLKSPWLPGRIPI